LPFKRKKMSTNDPEFVAMSVSSSTDAGEAATPGGDTPDLTAAKRKLSQTQGKPPFSLSSLPQARDDRIWDRIETEYNLLLGELSALKNFAVAVRPRGVLPRVESQGTVYKPNDERIRAEFTLSSTNDRNATRYTMSAELLVDSGASTELKLPARKVLQLGLRPCGRPVACRGSTSDQVRFAQVFSPVFVQVTFTRDAVEETVEAYLSVKCDKAEYDALVAVGNSGGSDPFSTPAAQASAATPGPSAAGNQEPITEIRLSPVKHRPIDAPLQQAVIGMDGLKKLHLHLNCEDQRLEIEEDEVLEEGEW
jgi:predicted aspartyl protease